MEGVPQEIELGMLSVKNAVGVCHYGVSILTHPVEYAGAGPWTPSALADVIDGMVDWDIASPDQAQALNVKFIPHPASSDPVPHTGTLKLAIRIPQLSRPTLQPLCNQAAVRRHHRAVPGTTGCDLRTPSAGGGSPPSGRADARLP